jgi:iron only hydrogenase large subunit-like protein
MGEYNIPAISESPIMDVFPYFSGEEGELEQIEKFNALKTSRPEAALEVEDNMEFAVEEETAS